MRIKLLIALGFLLIAAVSIGLLRWGGTDDGGLQLERPSLVALAATDGQEQEGVSFLQQEAGIAAWVKVSQIDLAQVRAKFKSPETDITVGDEYIIGEVALRDLPEYIHPHVYVNKDGWIVAYYSQADPTSKIFQWRGVGALTMTPLQEAIIQISSTVKIEEIKYHHFKYPNANRMMVIHEVNNLSSGIDSFYLTIPRGLDFFEASWSLHHSGTSYHASSLYLDGNTLISNVSNSIRYGHLSLATGSRQEIRVNNSSGGYAGQHGSTSLIIVLIYRV